MKLISMTDFVLEQDTNWSYKNTIVSIRDYANFLKQPLELWMFVPCDSDGNVLDEPKGTDLNDSFFAMQVDYNLETKYQQAKERCLFEGFEVDSEKTVNWNGIYIEQDSFNKINIEGLEYYCSSTKIKLTPTAIKQLNK
jgi:hypothetical protein